MDIREGEWTRKAKSKTIYSPLHTSLTLGIPWRVAFPTTMNGVKRKLNAYRFESLCRQQIFFPLPHTIVFGWEEDYPPPISYPIDWWRICCRHRDFCPWIFLRPTVPSFSLVASKAQYQHVPRNDTMESVGEHVGGKEAPGRISQFPHLPIFDGFYLDTLDMEDASVTWNDEQDRNVGVEIGRYRPKEAGWMVSYGDHC